MGVPRPAYSGRWVKVRRAVLKRDGWTCQIRIPGVCTEVATCVDHITPVAVAGPTFAPEALRAACKACNSHLAGELGQTLQRAAEMANVGPSRSW